MTGNIIDIFNFYVKCMLKVFQVMDAWKLVGGISFLQFLISCLIVIAFFNLLKMGVSSGVATKMYSSYSNKYSNERVRRNR